MPKSSLYPISRRPALWLAFGIAAVLPLPAFAQAGVPAGDIEEIVITATRVPTRLDRVGSSISVITAEEIERSQQPQAIDVLRRVPGVSISRSGGVGSTSLLRLRGSEPGMVKVLIDGVEMNDASSANREFDFNALLTDDIERIEVLRGPQSALYGNDAMAGVINIITRRGQGPLTVRGLIEGGAYDTFRQNLSVSGASGGVEYALSGSNYETDGFSRIAAGDEDDGSTARSVQGRLGFRPNEQVRIDLSGGWSWLDTDFDPGATSDGPAFQEKETLHGRAAGMLTGLDGRLETTMAVGASRTERDFDEPLGFYRFSTFDSDQLGVDLLSNLRLRTADVATLGVAWDREKAETTNTSAGVTAPGVSADVETWAVFGQYLAAVTEELTVTLGLRHDDHAQFGGETTWRTTAAYALDQTGTVFRASYGTARRAPSLYQLFDPSFGNAELEAEESWGADAGVEQSLLDGKVTAGVTVFRNRYDDLIAFTNGYVNVAEARSQGIEASLSARPASWLELSANYTWLDTKNLDTGRELPRRPRNMVNLAADIALTEAASLGADLRYVSSQLDRATATSPRLDGYTVVNLLGRWRVADGISLFGRIENLFDEEYEEVLNYNTPGRSAYGGVRVEF